MLFQHVPFEIRQTIFEYVSSRDKGSLKTCSTVCKSWYEDTAHMIYQTFTLTGDSNLCVSVLSNQTKERTFTNHFKTLKAFIDFRYKNMNLYDRITQYFPALRVLDLSRSNFQMIYLKSMVDKCHTMHQLRKIKVDPYFDHVYEFSLYFDCVYSLRNTLTYLELSNLNYDIRGSHKFLYFLKDFTNLKEIVIQNLEATAFDPSASLFPVLALVPGLVRFSIENDFEEGTGIDTQLSEPVYSCLEQATMRVPSFNDRLMKYVISSFPKDLKNFDLSITKTTTEDWILKNDPSIIESFGIYLSKIDQVAFSIKNCARWTPNFNSFSPSTLKEYWPFILKAMFTEHVQKCHVSISLNPPDYTSDQKTTNISIKKTHNQVYIGYIFDIDSMFLENIKQIHNFIDTVLPLPQATPSLNKQTITSMEILAKPPKELHSFVTIADSIHILKTAITEYTNLTYFHFYNYGELGRAYHIKAGTKLQDLEEGYGPYQCVFHDPPLIDSRRSSTRKLTHVLIESSRFTMIDLNAVADILHDMKYLKLLGFMSDERCERVMDFKFLKSLQTLVLDIGFLRYHFRFGTRLRIEFGNEKLVQLYKWCKVSESFIPCNKPKVIFGWSTNALKKEEPKKELVIKCIDVYEINLISDDEFIGKFINPLIKK